MPLSYQNKDFLGSWFYGTRSATRTPPVLLVDGYNVIGKRDMDIYSCYFYLDDV